MSLVARLKMWGHAETARKSSLTSETIKYIHCQHSPFAGLTLGTVEQNPFGKRVNHQRATSANLPPKFSCMMATPPFSNRARAFTLVEMIAVMAIIVIMLALTLPAVTSLTRAMSLTSGGDMVTNLIALARQTATSKNTVAALVLLGAQGTADADYRAFTVLHYSLDQQAWVQDTAWESLPTGIIVDFSDATNCTFLVNSPAPFPDLGSGQTNPPVTYLHNNVTSFAARIFGPDGGILNPQYPAQIRLVEGSVLGTTVYYSHRIPGGSGPADYYDLALLGATGQIKVGRP